MSVHVRTRRGQNMSWRLMRTPVRALAHAQDRSGLRGVHSATESSFHTYLLTACLLMHSSRTPQEKERMGLRYEGVGEGRPRHSKIKHERVRHAPTYQESLRCPLREAALPSFITKERRVTGRNEDRPRAGKQTNKNKGKSRSRESPSANRTAATRLRFEKWNTQDFFSSASPTSYF